MRFHHDHHGPPLTLPPSPLLVLPPTLSQSAGHNSRYTITVPKDQAILTARTMGDEFKRSDVSDAEARIRAAAAQRARATSKVRQPATNTQACIAMFIA